jgi:hypothetical protein
MPHSQKPAQAHEPSESGGGERANTVLLPAHRHLASECELRSSDGCQGIWVPAGFGVGSSEEFGCLTLRIVQVESTNLRENKLTPVSHRKEREEKTLTRGGCDIGTVDGSRDGADGPPAAAPSRLLVIGSGLLWL